MSCQRVTLQIGLVLLLLTINDIINLEITGQNHDEVHVENGDDQAVVIHRMTDEKLALRREILKLLRLPNKPKSADGKARLIKQSAAKFLLSVYRNNANKESQNKVNDSLEPQDFDNDLRTIDQNDGIITFTAQQSHQESEGMPDTIWFDVAAFPAEDRMTSAELRLYRGQDVENRKNHGAFTVTVYRVFHTKDGEREMQLVDFADTTAEHEGWITLNVTESLLHWMEHPGDNKGLYLSVRPIGRSSHETSPEKIGIVMLEGDAERQPFMAGFFRINGPYKPGLIQSTLRRFKDFHKSNKKRHISDVKDLTSLYTDWGDDKPGRSCKVQKLYVSFKDLGLQDWIISPEGYNANYCSGECNFPLPSRTDPTNHAIIQTIANLMHPETVPKTCCVPTKLSATDILYYVDDMTVVMRKWENMAVRGCGCH